MCDTPIQIVSFAAMHMSMVLIYIYVWVTPAQIVSSADMHMSMVIVYIAMCVTPRIDSFVCSYAHVYSSTVIPY